MSPLITKRATYLFTSFATLSTLGFIYKLTSSKSKTMLPPYKATFSVPLACDSCISDISAALSTVPGNRIYLRHHHPPTIRKLNFAGIQSTEFSLPSQLVTTTGTAIPSVIISTIQSTGRPAILRGSGASNSRP